MFRLPVVTGALAVALSAPTLALADHTMHDSRSAQDHVLEQRQQINHLRTRTWHYQDMRRVRRSRTRFLERNVHDTRRLDRLGWYWYRLLARAKRAYRRSVAAAPVAAGHWALWDCIHNGAYPGAPHEGTSSSGTYTGYLQMTNPWEGHPGDWGSMGTGVYAVAEREYAAHDYSRAWLETQWPRTSPPCVAKGLG